MDLVGITDDGVSERARIMIEAEASMAASDWVIFHLLLVRLLLDRKFIEVSDDGEGRGRTGECINEGHQHEQSLAVGGASV
ncbi:hypothetical protein CF336_g8190 [Tilletia laevis]|nr:hypothetical protein CF336_g8190 [Tilletia laevis]